jgi:hypothetical protein
MRAAQKALAYVCGTASWGLTYRQENSISVKLFADADFAGDYDTRASTNGNVIMINGTAVYWESKKQKSVAQSSTEAEFVAYGHAAMAAAWMRKLLKELRIPNQEVTKLHYDNTGAGYWIQDHQDFDRAKHIAVKYNYVRDEHRKGRIVLIHVPTKEMAADVITKLLPRERFEWCREAIGMTAK